MGSGGPVSPGRTLNVWVAAAPRPVLVCLRDVVWSPLSRAGRSAAPRAGPVPRPSSLWFFRPLRVVSPEIHSC